MGQFVHTFSLDEAEYSEGLCPPFSSSFQYCRLLHPKTKDRLRSDKKVGDNNTVCTDRPANLDDCYRRFIAIASPLFPKT